MNWLTNYVRPKIQQLVAPREVPDNLWHQCPSCSHMVFRKDLEKNLHVCEQCGHHMRLGAKARLELMFDDGEYQRIELPKVAVDPLKFRDLKRYTDRLKDAQHKTSEQDVIIVAHGMIKGVKTVVAVFDFSFMGGSMGMAVGEGIVAAANLAVAQETPLIVVPASGGARMQEGILSLMQMARTTVAIERVKEKGLPYIVLLTDPTTGGVTASFAMLADIALAESGAVIGFAGVRVIEKTIRQSLPDGFQRAEYLKDKGIVDIVVDRPNLSATLGNVLSLLMHQAPPAEVVAMPMDDAPADAVDAENAPPEAETDMDPVSETEQATTVATPDDTAAGAPESEVAAETKDKTE